MLEIPHDKPAEDALIGLLIEEPETYIEVCDIVDKRSFFDPQNLEIYSVLSEMSEIGQPVNRVNVCTELRKKAKLEACGGEFYIERLIESIPLNLTPRIWANEIARTAVQRKAIQLGEKISRKAQDPDLDIADLLENATDDINNLVTVENKSTSLKNVLARSLKVIEHRTEHPGVTGVTSGLKDLDELTAGFQKTNLIIVAARPRVGKTAFALNVSIAAAKKGNKVIIFSLEMGESELGLRMISIEGKVDSKKFLNGKLEPEDYEKSFSAIGRLSGLPVEINDNGNATIQYIRSKVKSEIRENGLDLVIIDYLQIMPGDNKLSREQQISEISRKLKAMAKEFDVPVMALSQLNRNVENKSDKHPGLSDLRESGAIEQDADLVIFLYRDEIHNKDSAEKGVAEIILEKQRQGPTGTARVAFVDKFTLFGDLAPGYQIPAPAPKKRKQYNGNKPHWQDNE